MPSSEKSPRHRRDAAAEYHFRRTLSARELLPALGIGIGAGLFAFYIARLFLQRTPLIVERSRPSAGLRGPRAERPDRA